MPFRTINDFIDYVCTRETLKASLDFLSVLNSIAIFMFSFVLAILAYEVFFYIRYPNQRPAFTLFFWNNPNLLLRQGST